jgi:NhaP-type Na+/H+ or K+/H+ antiporter
MAVSLALIVMGGLLGDVLFRKLKLPGLLGMLLAGVLVGPHVLDFLAPDMAQVSGDFRMIALIVILLRAGFELRRDTLNRVGSAAITMSCVPALLEIGAVTLLAPPLLGLTLLEAAILGCILGAVSPAVVVPLMIEFMERGKGADKGIPTLVLAASSLDDVFVIVIFTILMGVAGGGSVNWLWHLGSIPISITLGIISGLVPGYLLYRLFRRYDLKPPRRTIIVLGTAIGLMWVEHTLQGIVPVAGLLGVMAIGFIILEKEESIAHIISGKLKKLWVFAELLLFVLVGAQVDITVAWNAGFAGAVVIFWGLFFRSLGTYISLAGTDLDWREKLFSVVAYIPKATVQAAIGAVPLAAGLPGGQVILAVAVLSIIITAPIGAIGIKILGERILAEGRRPIYRFKDLRERLGLPRVGERVKNRLEGTVWKVIEERETWHNDAPPGSTAMPAITVRLWCPGKNQTPGTGPTHTLNFTPLDSPFDRDWEIVYGQN